MMELLLWPEGTPGALGTNQEDMPVLVPYLLEGEKEPSAAVVVCPGGGYHHRAKHEGEPVAKWLNSLGIAAFVVHYRVAPYRHPQPLLDAQRAIQLVRSRSEEWNVDANRVGILGFSAGGHLAASAGTLFHEGRPDEADPVARMSSRPDLMILCYPVITLTGDYVHQGSRRNLLGDAPEPDLVQQLSLQNVVTPETPPVFIWHTADDAAVPVDNALLFVQALRAHKVPVEFHMYESGRHGLGLAAEHSEAYTWPAACANWLRKHQFGLIHSHDPAE